MTVLNQCPFCGGLAAKYVGEHNFNDVKIRCTVCSSEGPLFDVDDGFDDQIGRNTKAAIAAWNKRVRQQKDGEITGKQWSAGRDAFVKFAERYRQAPSYNGASAVADIAPQEIYNAIQAATPGGNSHGGR